MLGLTKMSNTHQFKDSQAIRIIMVSKIFKKERSNINWNTNCFKKAWKKINTKTTKSFEKAWKKTKTKKFNVLNLIFLGVQILLNSTLLAFEGPLGGGISLKGFFPLIMISGIASTYGLLLEFIERESKIEDLRNEQMRSELSFLRSQISPHFIFNILNSIVYLIRTKADKKAEEVTIRLSSLMRYMLYDSDQSMVPLDREVEYVKNYIDLQRMRFEDDVQIDFEVKGAVDGSMIEPMLLIPFVENSFKHGVGFVREPYIKVLLAFQKGILHFEVENKIGKLIEDSKDDSSGIGLKNVKRRLELLYPNEHKIEVIEDDKLFKVQLDMSLNKKK
jgi:hypothetical protein